MLKRKTWMARKPKAKKEPGTKRRKLEEMDYWSLVKILDGEHSYQLRAGAAEKAGTPYVRCYTCDKIDHYKNMDCGHWQGRRYTGTRFDWRNTRIQCTTCNSFNEGRKDVFEANLKRDGVDTAAVKQLAEFFGQTHFACEELIGWIKEYRVENARIRKAIAGMDGV